MSLSESLCNSIEASVACTSGDDIVNEDFASMEVMPVHFDDCGRGLADGVFAPSILPYVSVKTGYQGMITQFGTKNGGPDGVGFTK